MRKTFRLTIMTAIMIGAAACTDLDQEILGEYNDEFIPENPGVGVDDEEGTSDGLEPAFARLLTGTANHGSYFSIQEVSSDEAVITQKGGDWFDGGIWLDMHRHDFKSTNDGVRNSWNDIYGGIVQCNEFIANATLSDEKKVQVRMARVYLYWRLLDLYGRVKIVTEPGVDAPQLSRSEVYDFVVAELEELAPLLPPGRPAYGRASQGAAYALLSRVYLNAGVYDGTPQYQKAIDAADMVINSGDYELDESYAAVFAPNNTANSEHIFVAAFDEATGTGMNFAQMTLHYPSQLTFKLQQQPWNGYSTLEEFYNSYEADDERKANNFIVGPQLDLQGNPILDLAFDKADPDGPEINYTPEINQLAPNGSRQAGARLGKFSFKIGQGNDMNNDYPLLRYGEVLLNKAEALCRLSGNWSNPDALALVNQLRARANVSVYNSMTEGEFLAERGRELFQEALRRNDLIRFAAWGDAWWEKPAHSDPNKNVFPIPNEQIIASQPLPFKLTQNPGY